MVKGISRQIILVHSPDTKLFEQAIFILKDNSDDITDDMLLREAKRIINAPTKRKSWVGPIWAVAGAVATGFIWLITIFL